LAGHILDHRDVERPTMSNYPERKTILCIDDDISMLDYQRALLERRGFAVVTAASARQGLEIAVACAVAAVVLDYHMPDMNGHEVATEIKRLRPQLPIVMVSSDEWIPEHTLNMVDAFVSKNEAHSCLVPAISKICGVYSPTVNLFQLATEEKNRTFSPMDMK
jgi:DNA-binding NtrC family response regulator